MANGKGKGIMSELMRAARKAAQSQPTPSTRRRTERDLLKMLEAHRTQTENGRAGKKIDPTFDPFSITSQLLRNAKSAEPPMEQDKYLEPKEPSRPPKPPKPEFGEGDYRPQPRAQPTLTLLETVYLENKEKSASHQRMKQLKNAYPLTSGPRLKIFYYKQMEKWPSQEKPGILETWKKLQTQELKALYTQAPRNAFEEWIQWTEQGKLWKFPIDNEQGIEEEKNVPFTEHIFLDSWLRGVPEKGPVRQFMELLLLGLSNNPYITVERKRETFDWFKRYFETQKSVLDKAGAL